MFVTFETIRRDRMYGNITRLTLEDVIRRAGVQDGLGLIRSGRLMTQMKLIPCFSLFVVLFWLG